MMNLFLWSKDSQSTLTLGFLLVARWLTGTYTFIETEIPVIRVYKFNTPPPTGSFLLCFQSDQTTRRFFLCWSFEGRSRDGNWPGRERERKETEGEWFASLVKTDLFLCCSAVLVGVGLVGFLGWGISSPKTRKVPGKSRRAGHSILVFFWSRLPGQVF